MDLLSNGLDIILMIEKMDDRCFVKVEESKEELPCYRLQYWWF